MTQPADRPLAASTARLGPPKAWQRNAVFGAVGFTIVLGYVGEALWGGLIEDHPLAVVLLNAKPRFLILTANHLDPWTYYLVGTLRLLCTKPLVWLVGAWYGDRAVGWAERRSARGASLIRWVERHFGRFGWVVIAITSNNVVCLLAGSTGFSLGWFLVLAVAGTVVRLWIFAEFAEQYERSIDDVTSFVGDHRAPVIVASVALLLVGLWWQRRSGGSQLDDLAALEHAVADDPEAEPG